MGWCGAETSPLSGLVNGLVSSSLSGFLAPNNAMLVLVLASRVLSHVLAHDSINIGGLASR